MPRRRPRSRRERNRGVLRERDARPEQARELHALPPSRARARVHPRVPAAAGGDRRAPRRTVPPSPESATLVPAAALFSPRRELRALLRPCPVRPPREHAAGAGLVVVRVAADEPGAASAESATQRAAGLAAGAREDLRGAGRAARSCPGAQCRSWRVPACVVARNRVGAWPDQGGLERIRTARTDEGHQRRAPWAVGTWSASRPRAIWPSVLPATCSERIRSATSEGTAGGRPTGARCGRGGTGRRRSTRYRSSSSTGISTRPPSSSTVSTNGTTLRLTVDALTPSASAACTIEYASRSTLSAGPIAPGSEAGRCDF